MVRLEEYQSRGGNEEILDGTKTYRGWGRKERWFNGEGVWQGCETWRIERRREADKGEMTMRDKGCRESSEYNGNRKLTTDQRERRRLCDKWRPKGGYGVAY